MRAWLLVVGSAAAAAPCVEPIACARARLSTASAIASASASASDWRVACDGTRHEALRIHAPARIASFVLSHDADASLDENVMRLSSAFARVDALASTSVSSFRLEAEPTYVHRTPVRIDPLAFANLTALETLTLQDVPLAEPVMHLVLPPSIAKIAIVGCGLQRLTVEIVGDANPSSLREVDLHTNNLVEIPSFFYDLPTNVVNLDVRLNKLAAISVDSSHANALQQWMKQGVLQIDNVKNPCPVDSKATAVQGLSQTFEVCVTSDAAAMPSATAEKRSQLETGSPAPRNTTRTDENEVANEAVDNVGPAPGKVHAPAEEDTNLPQTTKKTAVQPPQDTNTTTSKSLAQSPTVYLAIVGLGVVCAVLFTFSLVLVVARVRQSRDRGKSQSSALTSPSSDDLALSILVRSSSDINGESMQMGPPVFNQPVENRDGRSASKSSTSAMPVGPNGGNGLYTTMSTPNGPNQNYCMSESLQLLTGVSQFAISTQEKESESRQANKEKLRSILECIAKRQGTIAVNKTQYVCTGEVSETAVGAFTVRCHAPEAASPEANAPTQPLMLKIYVEQDIRVAIKEYRALLVMQSTTCQQYVAQMVATDMEKKLEGLKCAVLVIERGSATTFRHVVRGEIDRTKQLEVVQQLHTVVKAIDCLHERQFIHGGIHLDAMAVYPADNGRLKFCDLEHAARFGDTIRGSIASGSDASLEIIPPEMARYLVCSGTGPRLPSLDTMEADSYQVVRASASYDIWSLGVLILKIYANSRLLDEFDGCETPEDFFFKLADDSFNFERSLQLYVHHEDVRDLARACLCKDPRKRPKIAEVLSHRVFRAYDRLEEGDLVAKFQAHQLLAANKTRELLPPSLWLFLPPRELGLDKVRSVAEWVADITFFQEQQRQTSRFRTTELMFPLLFLCENAQHNSPCSSTGFHHARFLLPASLLSLVMPLVHESTLFLEAKAVISDEPRFTIPQLSGLGTQQWGELIKFYRALETMRLAPVSSFSLLLLKPLGELLEKEDPEQGRQVLDELKCLIFSQEKRDHVLSLLDILKTISINSDLDQQHEHEHEALDELSSVSDDDDSALATQPAPREWSRLHKCELERELGVSMPPVRWLCRRHWECEMECDV